ncbi:ArsR/SmtB family transcription factor [Sphingomonas sp. HMP6]|uniref:ArsR/SmtB family transcription factor n=1 Tax=Sphingomonas sp. HMP6 TaxID=1517551 RepID=UPI001596EC3B|nr:helix-turn-helix domain-containing protein [Sphingomonas sp. HMP6]BCA58148.1 hypothetical protein HMP06_0917 [Sphingomonas sp. HMP6]
MPDVTKILTAMGQGTRLDVLITLSVAPNTTRTSGELARSLNVPLNSMSTHLAVLLNAGLVEAKRSGRNILYRLNATGIDAVLDGLAERLGTTRRKSEALHSGEVHFSIAAPPEATGPDLDNSQSSSPALYCATTKTGRFQAVGDYGLNSRKWAVGADVRVTAVSIYGRRGNQERPEQVDTEIAHTTWLTHLHAAAERRWMSMSPPCLEESRESLRAICSLLTVEVSKGCSTAPA